MRSLVPAFIALLLMTALPGCVRRVAAPYQPFDAQGQPREEPPPGMVEVTAVSEYDDQAWDVVANGNVLCTTPCTQWVGAAQRLRLVANDGDRLFISGFGGEEMQTRHALLVAEGTCHGKQVNGIVFTSLGGMAIVTAIPFIAVGCSNIEKRGGLCTAGLITAGVSLPLTAAAIWMLADSGPKAHILPVFKAQASAGQPAATLAITPNGVAGTF